MPFDSSTTSAYAEHYAAGYADVFKYASPYTLRAFLSVLPIPGLDIALEAAEGPAEMKRAELHDLFVPADSDGGNLRQLLQLYPAGMAVLAERMVIVLRAISLKKDLSAGAAAAMHALSPSSGQPLGQAIRAELAGSDAAERQRQLGRIADRTGRQHSMNKTFATSGQYA